MSNAAQIIDLESYRARLKPSRAAPASPPATPAPFATACWVWAPFVMVPVLVMYPPGANG